MMIKVEPWPRFTQLWIADAVIGIAAVSIMSTSSISIQYGLGCGLLLIFGAGAFALYILALISVARNDTCEQHRTLFLIPTTWIPIMLESIGVLLNRYVETVSGCYMGLA
ncbi:hypothetical protein BVRB_040050, partial [Beta vulgaris subsp. vulgaris]